MIIEIKGTRQDAKKNYQKGLFSEWTPERIKRAFNNGVGTLSDLKEYAKNNRAFCTVVDTKKGAVL